MVGAVMSDGPRQAYKAGFIMAERGGPMNPNGCAKLKRLRGPGFVTAYNLGIVQAWLDGHTAARACRKVAAA